VVAGRIVRALRILWGICADHCRRDAGTSGRLAGAAGITLRPVHTHACGMPQPRWAGEAMRVLVTAPRRELGEAWGAVH